MMVAVCCSVWCETNRRNNRVGNLVLPYILCLALERETEISFRFRSPRPVRPLESQQSARIRYYLTHDTRLMGSVSSAEKVIMPVTREMVQQMVDADMVVIFSKSYCPYCKLAKEVFQKMKRQFTAIELDQRDDGDEIQSVLGEMTGERTVPRVFVNRKCLGGGTDVKKLYDSGKLEEMFPDA